MPGCGCFDHLLSKLGINLILEYILNVGCKDWFTVHKISLTKMTLKAGFFKIEISIIK